MSTKEYFIQKIDELLERCKKIYHYLHELYIKCGLEPDLIRISMKCLILDAEYKLLLVMYLLFYVRTAIEKGFEIDNLENILKNTEKTLKEISSSLKKILKQYS